MENVIFEWDDGHINSVANGGDNAINNFKPVCRSCNLLMGT
jgi:5-methylcytosine-specific restriction endonuclease McrA